MLPVLVVVALVRGVAVAAVEVVDVVPVLDRGVPAVRAVLVVVAFGVVVGRPSHPGHDRGGDAPVGGTPGVGE